MSIRTILLACTLTLSVAVQAQSYQELVRQAMTALGSDSISQAQTLLEQAISLDPAIPSNAILFQYLGEIHQRKGEGQKAIEAYGRGLDISPTNLDLLLGRASAYMQGGQPERALTDYTKVLEHSPAHEEARFFRAYILTQARRYREARADYETLLSNNPNHEDARLGLALLNLKTGRPREAIESLEALTILYPKHARHALALSNVLIERKEYERASTFVTQAVDAEPDNPDCYLTRATLCLELKMRDQARQDCQKALSLGANPDEVATLLSQITSGM